MIWKNEEATPERSYSHSYFKEGRENGVSMREVFVCTYVGMCEWVGEGSREKSWEGGGGEKNKSENNLY